MASYAELQRPPSRERLEAIAHAVAPGSRPGRVRRLSGGIDNGVHAIDLELPGQAGRTVVLRRYSSSEVRATAEAAFRARREGRGLELLERAGVGAPRLLLADPDGALSGHAANVISFVPGRPLLMPGETPDWAEQLATAIRRVHETKLSSGDLASLAGRRPSATALEREEPPERVGRHPLGVALWRAIRKEAQCLEPVEPVLVHTDYWAGNTLWRHGRLLAIIDWDQLSTGEPAEDVAYMWMDTQLIGEREAAVDFVAIYRSLAGGPLENWRFYALTALARPLPDPAVWLPSWEGSGRQHLEIDEIRARLNGLILETIG